MKGVRGGGGGLEGGGGADKGGSSLGNAFLELFVTLTHYLAFFFLLP